MKAYILINVRIGSITEVIHNLRTIDGIIDANMTFGPYDAVAVVKAETVNHLGRLIAEEIHPIPGVRETITCLITEA